ncbi:predicted protein [Uncinocarpus reesii 1704]|uniref:Uncharacterized protein n=1 Tax=Uncinocarpus reesii (strain UAMH 1704) TaxID=336963 RepID=C4JZB7_UNCRE|nr:uncharacterized protein UREG_07518 [Uncinocarpus reesii 1704]EEP82653.1 predicted protein [Uncinocarpus reesii 1704]
MGSNPPPVRSKPTTSKPPATSKWCNRALRPLTSAILRLEKHCRTASIQPDELVPKSADNPLNGSRSKKDGGRTSGGTGASDSESARDDPTWIPGNAGAGRKRVKHKYSSHKESSRGNPKSRLRRSIRSPEAEKLQPGEFTVATPLILGKKKCAVEENRHFGTTCQVVEPRLNEAAPPNPLKNKSIRNGYPAHIPVADIDVYGDPSYISMVGGILNAFDTFLKITSIEQNPHQVNRAPSLLSMALNKTSEYIFHEQARLDNAEDNKEDIDVADIFFTELEDTYAASDQGWRPLRALVRAHGIRLVCETIRKRLIHPRLGRHIISKILEIPAKDAANAVLEALLSVVPALPPPKSLDSALLVEQLHVWSLGIYMRDAPSLTVFSREISHLLLRGVVPAEWMATTSMKSYLVDAIQSTVSNDEHSAASVKFLMAVLQASLAPTRPTENSPANLDPRTAPSFAPTSQLNREGLRSTENTSDQMRANNKLIADALNNTICSILTVLCSAHVARFRSTPSTDSPMWHIVTYLSTVAQRCTANGKLDKRKDSLGAQQIRIGYILIAQYLLEHIDPPGSASKDRWEAAPGLLNGIEHLIRLSPNRNELLTGFSSFFLQVARCLSRGEGEDGFTTIKSLTTLFESSRLRAYPAFRASLAKIAVDLALNFAETTCLRCHHEWASDLQERVADLDLDDKGLEPLTPSLCFTTTAFRWEDGIGEWVARTPCVNRNTFNRGNSLKGPHQPRNLSNEKVVKSSTTSDDSDSEYDSMSDSGSTAGRSESSVISSSCSPPLLSRKRKFGSNSCGFTADDHIDVISGTTPTMKRWRNKNRSRWDVYVDLTDGKVRGPVTRNQCALQESKKTNNKARAIAVSVAVPPVNPLKRVDFEVVIHVNKSALTPTPIAFSDIEEENDVKEAEEETEKGEEEDDDVISASGPTLSQRFRDDKRRLSHLVPVPQPKAYARRRSSARLAVKNQQRKVIPCSDCEDSSDDELSFL